VGRGECPEATHFVFRKIAVFHDDIEIGDAPRDRPRRICNIRWLCIEREVDALGTRAFCHGCVWPRVSINVVTWTREVARKGRVVQGLGELDLDGN